MQLNVLDDLAEAMKALDGKKRSNLRAKKDDLCGHFKIAILAQFLVIETRAMMKQACRQTLKVQLRFSTMRTWSKTNNLSG